jgi:hypothetical protein
MTFRRLVNRNGLASGGYDDAADWKCPLNLTSPGLGTMDQLREAQWPSLVEEVGGYEQRIQGLLGDLRRLEKDSIDEQATAHAIAIRTGIDVEVVAAVLKEFIGW